MWQLALACGGLLALAAFFLAPVLVVEGPARRWVQLWLPGRSFCLEFVHSVERTPVRDCVSVAWDGKFVVKETRYYSYGAGLAAEGRLEDGGLVLVAEGQGTRLAQVVVRVSGETQPALYAGRVRVDLTTFAEEGGRVRLEVRRPWQLLRPAN